MLTSPLKLTMLNLNFTKKGSESRIKTNLKLQHQNQEHLDKSKKGVTNPNEPTTFKQIQNYAQALNKRKKEYPCHPIVNKNKTLI